MGRFSVLAELIQIMVSYGKPGGRVVLAADRTSAEDVLVESTYGTVRSCHTGELHESAHTRGHGVQHHPIDIAMLFT